METFDTVDLDTVLLALILVALLIQTFLFSSSSDRRSLRDHNDRLARSIDDPAFDRELRRNLLLEAIAATRIEEEFERFAALALDEFRAALADEGYLTTNEQRLRRIKAWFTRDRASAIGSELFKKVLGLVNKHFGLG